MYWSICRVNLAPLYCNATSHANEQLFSCPWCRVPATAAHSPLTLTLEEQQRSDSNKPSAGRVRRDRIQIRGALLLLIFVLGEEWRRMDKTFSWLKMTLWASNSSWGVMVRLSCPFVSVLTIFIVYICVRYYLVDIVSSYNIFQHCRSVPDKHS